MTDNHTTTEHDRTRSRALLASAGRHLRVCLDALRLAKDAAGAAYDLADEASWAYPAAENTEITAVHMDSAISDLINTLISSGHAANDREPPAHTRCQTCGGHDGEHFDQHGPDDPGAPGDSGHPGGGSTYPCPEA